MIRFAAHPLGTIFTPAGRFFPLYEALSSYDSIGLMRFLPVFGFTEADQWHAGIGDPTIMGWLTVVGYAVAAMLCFRGAWLEGEGERSRVLFWASLGAIMVGLGINKQLDLQTWFTLTVKKMALSEGWYERRRLFQFIFIGFIAAGGILGFLGMWRLVHCNGADLRLPLFGLFVVICFVLIRAASFHHVDQFLKVRIGGVKMNWLLELSGISIIALGALKRRRPRTSNPRRPLYQNA